MKARTTTIIVTGILLCVAVATVAFTLAETVQAVQGLQHQGSLMKTGDVRTVRSWMTIPYIAHTYHVPGSYLYTSIGVTNSAAQNRASLYALATQKKRPVATVVSGIQHAIVAYRKQHPHHAVPIHPTSTRNIRPTMLRRSLF